MTPSPSAPSKLTDGIRSLVMGNELASAGSLIGRTITAKDEQGKQVNGKVEKVVMSDGRARLVVGGAQVQMAAVSEITG